AGPVSRSLLVLSSRPGRPSLALRVRSVARLICLGIAPLALGFAGVVVILTAVNGIGALADLFAQSLLQLSVPRQLRGRAGGAWVVAIGLAPLGQMQIGALASAFGVSVGFAASGLALALLALATAVLAPRARRL